MTDRKKFDETELPPLEKWVNSLDGDKIDINATNLIEAKENFNQFNCRSLRDYHDLSLSCDTMLRNFALSAIKHMALTVLLISPIQFWLVTLSGGSVKLMLNC